MPKVCLRRPAPPPPTKGTLKFHFLTGGGGEWLMCPPRPSQCCCSFETSISYHLAEWPPAWPHTRTGRPTRHRRLGICRRGLAKPWCVGTSLRDVPPYPRADLSPAHPRTTPRILPEAAPACTGNADRCGREDTRFPRDGPCCREELPSAGGQRATQAVREPHSHAGHVDGHSPGLPSTTSPVCGPWRGRG